MGGEKRSLVLSAATSPRLSCLLLAGFGQNLPVVISSLGAQSRSDNGIVFSYAPPSVSDISLSSSVAPTGGSRRRQLALADGVPTLGANLTITGSCFSSDAFVGASVSLDAQASLPTLLHTDTTIVVAIPPGDGAGHTLTVVVGGRPSAPVSFAYTAPIVNGISPTHGSTAGGGLVTVTGSNFGGAPGAWERRARRAPSHALSPCSDGSDDHLCRCSLCQPGIHAVPGPLGAAVLLAHRTR